MIRWMFDIVFLGLGWMGNFNDGGGGEEKEV